MTGTGATGHPRVQGGGEQRPGPTSLPLSPPLPPRPAGHGGAGPPPPPGLRGVPTPPHWTMTPGGGRSWICTPRAPAPPTVCSRGGRDRRGSPHQRARTTHGPHLGAARDDEPEQYGGRARHDQSIANAARKVARSGRIEGRTGSVGASGGAVHGPPLPPPPCRAGPPAAGRTRRTGLPRDPDRTRTPGGNVPATKRGLGREPQATPPEREQGGHGMTPPPVPPPLPTSPQATGAPAPTPPEAEGMIPPPPGRTAAPEREAGAGPAPTPQPLAPAGTTKNRRTRANTPGRHTNRARGQQASTTRSGMGATPSMARATPRTPALLPAQGRQTDGLEQGDPPPHLPPRPRSRGARRTGRPPRPTPPHPPALEHPRRADPLHGERTVQAR